ncbi:hypothetical protein GPECTOR_18g27 [Gonium pectorale]|uniref:Protein kinase domain-containing protein n=1 Tax=Gonium pectorale TaxID=33097 RepID=A0A150GJR3_GONPE|nr:hypothetical protein GPECTOR_18g27 [Gonium pectorale]|eukprot:KXZ50046.1 hypothetical protein GPECTOR_18g27 [Gonium pectorale]
MDFSIRATFTASGLFWVESEDELEESGSDLSATDDEYASCDEDAERKPRDEHPLGDASEPPTAGCGAGDEYSTIPVAPKRSGKTRRNQAARHEDRRRCGDGLMLPEELWDAWARLSDGPGRQYRMLESLTNAERISCTSYSTVSKALKDGQLVVVKIYDVAEREKLANAFAEIGVLLHLARWPGAVKLLDYGRHEDKVMLMLESCDESLKAWCDNRRFAVASARDFILEVLRLWCTLADLMAELHDRWHVAHCDLKPGNVLLTGGHLKLADFSESMLFNGTPLLSEQARGTFAYQPPEMAYKHTVDARKADVWAMGCILYEMVTGEVLFKGHVAASEYALAPAGAQASRSGNVNPVLVRSTASQCADPAGPDWFTTEEADRMRIMCEEAPSFVSVCIQRNLPHSLGSAGGAPASSRSHSSGWSDAGEAMDGYEFYKPRLLSGAEGGAGLIFCRSGATDISLGGCLAALMAPDLDLDVGCSTDVDGGAATGRAAPVAPALAAEASNASAALDSQFALNCGILAAKDVTAAPSISRAQCSVPPLPPRLPLAALQLRGFGAPWHAEDVQLEGDSARTEAGSWEEEGSAEGDAGCEPGDEGARGAGRPSAGTGSDARAISLFDACQPLQTSRGTQPVSRTWARFINRAGQ